MINIKLSLPPWPIIRQSPGHKGIWNNYRFFCNTQITSCDYWFVLEGLDTKQDSTTCPKEHTVLITCEPPTLKTYKSEFLHQFAAVITSDINIDHPNPIFQQSGLPWHVGRRQTDHSNLEFSKDYDELKAMTAIPKTKLLSVISSSKQMSEGHRQRYEFALGLKNYFGNRIDLFGRGLNEVEDKWDALAAYKYHVAMENSDVEDYWTEKLADAFLAGCHPIYYGCPNIDRYFDLSALTTIDITQPDKAIAVIEKCIEQKKYESSERKIWEAREKVLDHYNLFALIADYIATERLLKSGQTRPSVKVTIRKEPSESNLLYQLKKKLLKR